MLKDRASLVFNIAGGKKIHYHLYLGLDEAKTSYGHRVKHRQVLSTIGSIELYFYGAASHFPFPCVYIVYVWKI